MDCCPECCPPENPCCGAPCCDKPDLHFTLQPLSVAHSAFRVRETLTDFEIISEENSGYPLNEFLYNVFPTQNIFVQIRRLNPVNPVVGAQIGLNQIQVIRRSEAGHESYTLTMQPNMAFLPCDGSTTRAPNFFGATVSGGTVLPRAVARGDEIGFFVAVDDGISSPSLHFTVWNYVTGVLIHDSAMPSPRPAIGMASGASYLNITLQIFLDSEDTISALCLALMQFNLPINQPHLQFAALLIKNGKLESTYSAAERKGIGDVLLFTPSEELANTFDARVATGLNMALQGWTDGRGYAFHPDIKANGIYASQPFGRESFVCFNSLGTLPAASLSQILTSPFARTSFFAADGCALKPEPPDACVCARRDTRRSFAVAGSALRDIFVVPGSGILLSNAAENFPSGAAYEYPEIVGFLADGALSFGASVPLDARVDPGTLRQITFLGGTPPGPFGIIGNSWNLFGGTFGLIRSYQYISIVSSGPEEIIYDVVSSTILWVLTDGSRRDVLDVHNFLKVI